MKVAHEALSDWWRATNHHSKPAEDAEATARRLEETYGCALPDDFRAYIIRTAPTDDLWDAGDATWWPAVRIKSIPDEYEGPVGDPVIAAQASTYLVFADYMIWCWAWAICCADGDNRGKVAIIGGSPDRIVADSFSEFVDHYVNAPQMVC